MGREVTDDDWDDDEDPITEIVAPEFEVTKLHNGKLEFAMLLRVLVDPMLQGRLWPRLEEGHFAADSTRAIFKRLRNLNASGIEWPTVSALSLDPALPSAAQAQLAATVTKVANGSELIDTTIELSNGRVVPMESSADFEGLVYELLESYRVTREGMQRYVEVVNDIADDDEFDPLKAPELIERAAAEVLQLKGDEDIAENIMHFGHGLTEDDRIKRDQERENIYAETQVRFPTGIRGYDEKAGGFQPGEVVLLGATTGGGKTAAAMTFMVNQARQGISCAMIQLELSLQQMSERMSSHLARINSEVIRKGKLTDDDKVKIKEAWDEFNTDLEYAQSRMTIYCPSSATVNQIEMIFKAYPYKIWYVDYASLVNLEGSDSQLKGWEKLSKITKELKRLAKKYKITIVIGIQVNVDKDGKVEVRYAKAMKEDADVVLVWQKTEEAWAEGVVWWQHLKARQYEPFDFPVKLALEYYMFESFRDQQTRSIRRMLGKKNVHTKDDLEEAVDDVDPMFKKKEQALEVDEDLDLDTAVPTSAPMSMVDAFDDDEDEDDEFDDE